MDTLVNSLRCGRVARVALFVSVFTLAVGCSSKGEDVTEAQRPVVVVITLDTTRADRLGCYGYEGAPTSPRMDEFAKTGTLFTRAIAQAAVTPVSHASIFTGLNPYNHGLRALHGGSQNQLDEAQVTLAEILRDEGYKTGAFVSAFPVTEYFGFEQGFETFNADFAPENAADTAIRGGTVNTGSVQRHAGQTTKRALDWMAKTEGPFFLWLHYFDPHDELALPPQQVMQGRKFSEVERTRRNEIYDVELAFMDSMIGLVFDKLKELDHWDNCVIVITADHGEGLGDHDWWTHGILYQEQIRVPLIVRGPGVVAGRRVDSVVRTIDIVPTVADLVGLGASDLPKMDGVSLRPLLNGESADLGLMAYSDSVDLLVYRISEEIQDNKTDMLFSIIFDNRWKFIQHLRECSKSELYDLNNDPNELVNLAKQEPELVERAHEELKRLEFMPYSQLESKNVPQAVIDNLRALGYIDAESGKRDSAQDQ